MMRTPRSFEGWRLCIGEYVKFVDEQAVIEAHIKGTQFPMLYPGKLVDVLPIRIYQDEVIHAKIIPLWTNEPKFIPVSNVRMAE